MDWVTCYLALGWRVFPVHEMTESGCSCERVCKSPGKHPRVQSGLNAATEQHQRCDKMARAIGPNMNVGVVNWHYASGIVVIDVDPDRYGDQAFELIENDLPKTVKQITGSGGFHLIYKLPPGVVVKNATNIDDGDCTKIIRR